jgi:hypothetical protein
MLCLFRLLTGKNTGKFGPFMGVRVVTPCFLGCFAEMPSFGTGNIRELAGNALEVFEK